MNRRLLLLLTALACAPFARAATNGFVVPAFRGQPDTAFAGWEIFTVATNNGVGNLPDLPGSSAAGARLLQLDPNAVVTGGGNIYDMPAISVFEVRYAAAAPLQTVVFQARTVGFEIDYDHVRLTYDLGGGEQALFTPRTETDRVFAGLGDAVSSLWTWDLTGTPGVTDITIKFAASASSLSLDSATIDVQGVPEPGPALLLGAGLLALGLRRWTGRGHTTNVA
ncbi:MAG TPA: PEP-CTERM sorting domain-containing protein [Verrucomicrobiota bacterium]|nr:PEP-CTERM sorting domain-containing protein [Verrucomicrobiota bacterium]